MHDVCDSKTKFKTRRDRSFAAAAPKLWNNVTVEVKESPGIETRERLRRSLIETVKLRLQTHLFPTVLNQSVTLYPLKFPFSI